MNHYDALGLDKTASKTEIKKAFKNKAMKLHPDRDGGNENKFKCIQKAYDVLSDDEKRKRYDQTGETEGKQKSIEDKATSFLAELFSKIVNSNDFSGDIINSAHKKITTKEHSLECDRKLCLEQISKLEKQLGRVISDGEFNLFENVIQSNIQKINDTVGFIEEYLNIISIALEMIEEYSDARPESESKYPLNQWAAYITTPGA